jgi:uncharacterized protein (TIGR03437 family)
MAVNDIATRGFAAAWERRAMGIVNKLFLGGALAAATLAAQDRAPRLDTIVNSASGKATRQGAPTLGVGGWATIKGEFPITTTCSIGIPLPGIPCPQQEYCQASFPLPEELCGVTIEADGRKLPILYIDKEQATVILPDRTNEETIFKAYASGVASNELKAPVTPTGIGIFHDGKRLAIAFTKDYQLHGRERPLDNTLPDDGSREITILTTGAGLPENGLEPGVPAPYDSASPTPRPIAKLDGIELPDAVRSSIAAPGYVAVQQHVVNIPAAINGSPLEDGAHTLELCVTQGTTSCDKTDLLVHTPGQRYLNQNITIDDRGKAAEGTVTLTDLESRTSRSYRMTEHGNLLIPKADSRPVEIVIAAGPEYAEYHDTITDTIPTFTLPQYKEFPESKFTYHEDRNEPSCNALLPSGRIPCHKWVAGDTPMNNIDAIRYFMADYRLSDLTLKGIWNQRWPALPITIDLRLSDAPKTDILVRWVLDANGTPVRAITKPLPDAFKEIVDNYTFGGKRAFRIVSEGSADVFLTYNLLEDGKPAGNYAGCRFENKPYPSWCKINLYPDPNALDDLGYVLQHELLHVLGLINHDPDRRSVFHYGMSDWSYLPFTTQLPAKFQEVLHLLYSQDAAPDRKLPDKNSVFLKFRKPAR